MNCFYWPIQQYGVRAMIGKAGFLQDTVEAMQKFGGSTRDRRRGGRFGDGTDRRNRRSLVEDLMPECLWKFRVKNFVADCGDRWHGNSLTRMAQAAEKIKAMGL
jgi:tartrate dehydratase beta subunit/fumarate hydratase class I family protein